MIQKYGVTNVSKVHEFAEKAGQSQRNMPKEKRQQIQEHSRKVRLERYGSYNNGKKISESLKKRTAEQKKTTIEKRQHTVEAKYGVSNI